MVKVVKDEANYVCANCGKGEKKAAYVKVSIDPRFAIGSCWECGSDNNEWLRRDEYERRRGVRQ